MANAREIQSRMKSIQDTMKITNAMYMISSSKLKKAKQSLAATEPYFYALQMAIGRILRHMPDIHNVYFDEREHIAEKDRKKGYIVVTADKGLAGAYNHNVIKMAEEHLGEGEHPLLFVLGELGRHYFTKQKMPIEETFHYTVQNPSMNRARNIAERILALYEEGKLDDVYIIYTKMTGPVQTETEMLQLLPLKQTEFGHAPLGVPLEEIVMKPSAEAVMNNIVPNYVAGFIYGALVECFASEHNSRMMAMEAATKSAKDMLRELEIEFNRVRQAAITQEITEVISGAKAQKRKKKS